MIIPHSQRDVCNVNLVVNFQQKLLKEIANRNMHIEIIKRLKK